MTNITLSDGEWKLMNALWAIAPCTLTELVRTLEEETGWSKSTVFVMLKRLCVKEAVGVENEGKKSLYVPLVAKSDAAQLETSSFLTRVYDGSVGMMLSSLAGHEGLTQSDIDELRRILDEAEGKLK